MAGQYRIKNRQCFCSLGLYCASALGVHCSPYSIGSGEILFSMRYSGNGWRSLLRLTLKTRDSAPAEATFDFFNRADDQLIAWLGLGRIDRVGRQLKHAGCLDPQWRDAEPGKMLDDMYDPVVLIQVDQVEREEHTQCMNSLRGHYPESLVELELQPSDEPF
jgi:hypothetical protein